MPNGDKLEMRVQGPSTSSPGYRHNDEATRGAFDEDGYYCIGDAGYLARTTPTRAQGVVFNGRVAEDFKLTSGTWVSRGHACACVWCRRWPRWCRTR